MEFVRISFQVRRPVLIDGVPAGLSGDTLMVSRGLHRFELAGPPDYTPQVVEKMVSDSSPADPVEIIFYPQSWPPPGGTLPPEKPSDQPKSGDSDKRRQPGEKRKK